MDHANTATKHRYLASVITQLCIKFRRLRMHNPTGLMVRRLEMSNCAIIMGPIDSYLSTQRASSDTHLNTQETRNDIILNINMGFVNKVLLAMLLILFMSLDGFLTDFNVFAWSWHGVYIFVIQVPQNPLSRD